MAAAIARRYSASALISEGASAKRPHVLEYGLSCSTAVARGGGAPSAAASGGSLALYGWLGLGVGIGLGIGLGLG